jgi:ceramide glucosyltransferase
MVWLEPILRDVSGFFIIVAFIGSLYQILAAWAVAQLSRQPRPTPVRRPPVTLLKPLCGDEPGLYHNLQSFCEQDYPLFQLVCGVRDPDDPAIAIVQRLQADRPEMDIALVVNPVIHGTNYKVSNLINILQAAKHDVLVLSDSDMRVRPDYLEAISGALEQPGTGLATCLYTGEPLPGPWSAIGAAGINFWFLPSAAVSKLLGGKTGCYGATIAMTRKTLESVGGFMAVRNQLADDYALGALVRQSGLNIVVAPYFPATQVDEPSFPTLLRHELRWARTVRNTAPIGYAGSIITHPLPLAMLGILSGSVAGLHWPVLLAAIVMAAMSRLWLVRRVTYIFRAARPGWWVLLARDVLSLGILVAAYLGRSVSWRNSAFRVDRVGALSSGNDGN